MTRVIHTGDTHLGYRQYHSPERRDDFLAAFRRVVEDAIAEEVDAVVHAGDLFHDRSPSLADVHGAILVLRDLREAGIPFLAVVGNHERTRGGQWLDLFSTLGLATRLGAEPTPIGDVAFYGLDFVPRSKRDGLEYDFSPHDAEFAALVTHGLFTPFNAEWNSKEVLSSSPVDFDAMLLGDDHQHDTARVEGTWVTYCGSTERTSAAERDERGYNIVEFDGASSATGDGVSIRRRGIETRPFVTVDVELSDGEGGDRVRERLREESLADAVVVVSVDGAGENLKPARIEEFASDRGALVARVTDRREIATADLDAVRFADPDAAVRERIRELGLSEAALAIDETVRSEVADSNVRDRVRERIEELMDEPGSLVPQAPTEAGGDAEGSPGGETEERDGGERGPRDDRVTAGSDRDAIGVEGANATDDPGSDAEPPKVASETEDATGAEDAPVRTEAMATTDDDGDAVETTDREEGSAADSDEEPTTDDEEGTATVVDADADDEDEAEDGDETTGDDEDGRGEEEEPTSGETEPSADEGATESPASDEAGGTDDQVTMEDFL